MRITPVIQDKFTALASNMAIAQQAACRSGRKRVPDITDWEIFFLRQARNTDRSIICKMRACRHRLSGGVPRGDMGSFTGLMMTAGWRGLRKLPICAKSWIDSLPGCPSTV